MGNSAPEVDDLLTSAQVAEITGWSQTSINRWALNGDLPSEHKNPGKTGPRLFRRSVVEQRIRARGTTSGLIRERVAS
jgi:predicted DNA-binding transcriptional regulator AlpA